MEAPDESGAADEPPAIRDRSDAGRGWTRAWPLIALALIGLMLVRTCVPSLPATAPAPLPGPSTSH